MAVSTIKHIFINNWNLLVKFFHYNKQLFFVRVFYSIIASLSTIARILFPKYLLTAILGGNVQTIFVVGIGFGFFMLTFQYIGILYNYYDSYAREKTYVKIINEFLCKTLDLDLSFFDRTESYSKYSRALGNCCDIVNKSNQSILALITSTLQIVMISAILVWIEKEVFVIILLSVLISFVLHNRLGKTEYIFSKKMSDKNKQVNYLYRL